ncbi:MAG: hypothetical protein Q4C49_11390 [Bacillota bacterium]|nr:hypothetical protein [Bacillota bacterium]
MAKNRIFREKTYERINSPEQLDQYLKTSNPGLWLMMTGIIVVLCGMLVWSFMGRLETKLVCGSNCENGDLSIYVWEGDFKNVENGMSVIVKGEKYTISSISSQPIQVEKNIGRYAQETGGLHEGEWVYVAHAKTSLPDGSYKAEIIIESVAPKTFILN